jgi:cell division protease FtsH
MARAMVTQMGYSDQLGMVAYGDNQEEVFLGMSMGRQQNVSEETARKIDAEVRRLIEEGYVAAKKILTEKHQDFVTLAEALLEFETLTGDEIKDLINGKRPVRDASNDDKPSAPRGSTVPLTGARPKAGDSGLEPQPTA